MPEPKKDVHASAKEAHRSNIWLSGHSKIAPVNINKGDKAVVADGVSEILPFPNRGRFNSDPAISIVDVGDSKLAWNDLEIMVTRLFAGIDEMQRHTTHHAGIITHSGVADYDQLPKSIDWDVILTDVSRKIEERKPASETKHSTEFRPSGSIVDLLKRGIEKFSSEHKTGMMPERIKRLLLKTASSKFAAMFAHELSALIGSVAFRVSDGREPNAPLTVNGEFNSFYLSAFLEVFPIWPTDLGLFQEKLRVELIKFLSSGGEYNGAWGKLRVKRGELIFEIGANTIDRLPDRGRPRAALMPR